MKIGDVQVQNSRLLGIGATSVVYSIQLGADNVVAKISDIPHLLQREQSILKRASRIAFLPKLYDCSVGSLCNNTLLTTPVGEKVCAIISL